MQNIQDVSDKQHHSLIIDFSSFSYDKNINMCDVNFWQSNLIILRQLNNFNRLHLKITSTSSF